MIRRALLVTTIVLLHACSAVRAPLVATDVIVNKPRPGMQMTAGYLALTNNTKQPITITHVTSPDFGSVDIHESILEEGVSRMHALADLTVPAGETVRFEPGGKHLMLTRPLGETDTVTLNLHAGESVMLTVNVELTD